MLTTPNPWHSGEFMTNEFRGVFVRLDASYNSNAEMDENQLASLLCTEYSLGGLLNNDPSVKQVWKVIRRVLKISDCSGQRIRFRDVKQVEATHIRKDV